MFDVPQHSDSFVDPYHTMLSIIIPFHNEAENLPILIKHLIEMCEKISDSYEIILVDDGSNDASVAISNFQFPTNEPDQRSVHGPVPSRRYVGTGTQASNKIKILRHKKRLGKGQALQTGLEQSKGDLIVFMDADLQDDPEELVKFLKKIDEGFDFVNGKRVGRKDNLIIKIYSGLAKHFLRIFLNSPYTDINCGYKAFKREVLSDFTFYGNNFRFFPLAVFYNGYKVTEIPVTNQIRRYGKSKFGVTKVFTGALDTLAAYFIYKFSEKPLHFFGIIGGVSFVIGFLISLYLSIERLFFGVLLYRRPVLFLGLLLMIIGIQIIMTGIIGELIVYLDKKKK